MGDSTLSTVDLKSTPDGAEITVDEKFMGSTPSSLRLAVGHHDIKLEKSGFKTLGENFDCGRGHDSNNSKNRSRPVLKPGLDGISIDELFTENPNSPSSKCLHYLQSDPQGR